MKILIPALLILSSGLNASVIYTFSVGGSIFSLWSFSVSSPDFIPVGSTIRFTNFDYCQLESLGLGRCVSADINQGAAGQGISIASFYSFSTGGSSSIQAGFTTETPYTLGSWQNDGLGDNVRNAVLTVSQSASVAPEPATFSMIGLALSLAIFVCRLCVPGSNLKILRFFRNLQVVVKS
ncbi:MAG: hypothetical protein ACJ746_23885 [Bryobacteraceae bacterium]